MRVVFMGTPAFAVPSLDALLADRNVVAVYTRPDAAVGRGRRLSAPEVKQRALRAGIRVEQPPTLRAPSALEMLRSLEPDLIVVAAYGAILPPDVIAIPGLGCVNVHASLLPRWRGAAPIQRAILAGDGKTGVSIMRMEEGLDTGPWCAQESTDVGDKTAASLTDELAAMGARALTAAIPLIGSAECTWTVQDESCATYAAKLTPADVALDPTQSVVDAWRRVRASGPSAPCRILVDGRRLSVISASTSTAAIPAGGIASASGLELGFSDGALRLDRIVPEGKSVMSSADWLRGARIASDAHWSRT